ncbi:hypothetical protein EMPS_01496 [Entomortierella parvispora]|uniref:Uncharacterized protein n=1 Tax=Entomortierella parvispora TaxID=205924 RepID=A0A9P3H2Z2_9FUNG|nr:hypothetical protein EMPS_01496 [Entomortierella parvispora]
MDDHQSFVAEAFPGSDTSSQIINIEVATDPTTDEKFIFWEDIETFFPGLQHVRRDNIMVAYMRDKDGHRYQPKRLKRYPGVILQVSLAQSLTSPPTIGNENDGLDGLPPKYSASCPPNTVAVTVPVEEKRVWVAPSPVALSMIGYASDPNPSSSSQQTQLHPISPEGCANPLLRLRCPRFFLVLPMDGHPLDEIAPDKNKFTVHFLCYGGEAMKVKVPCTHQFNAIPGHVHLCGHPGYELERPIEFFDQYGSYILNMLQMLQHGLPIQGKTVPSLNELDYRRTSREGRGGIEYMRPVREDLEHSIFQMISYLQTKKKGHEKSFEEHVRTYSFDSMAETTDLSGIRSYFKDLHASEKNEDQHLGHLLRGNMEEDDSREVWLCHPHYDVIFDTKAAKELRVSVNWHRGFYQYENRRLKLVLKMDKTTSFRNYSYLIGGCKNARELDLMIDCDPTVVELDHLGNIIALMTLHKITINLKNLSRSTGGLFGRGKSTNYLVHILLTSPELEVVQFKEIDDFFSKSLPFRQDRQTRLQEIHIDSLFDPRAHSEKLTVLFNQCPQLKTLSLACPKGYRFIETIELVKELLLNHKYFQYLNVTCPSFKATFDRAEPGSLLLDRPLPPLSGLRAQTMILERYWLDLETIILDDDFCDEEINAVAELLPKHTTKLRQFIIARNLVALKTDMTSDTGQSKLLKVVRVLSQYPLGLKAPSMSRTDTLPGQRDEKEATVAPVRSLVSFSEVSSPQPPSRPAQLCEISLRIKYPQGKHRRLASDVFPYVVCFELNSPFMNDVINQLHHSVHLKGPSLIRCFRYSGAYNTLKDMTLENLVQILKLCPNLESLRLSDMKMKTEQWRQVLGCLDYSRVKILEFPKAMIGLEQRRLPVEIFPADAILQELNLYKAYLGEPFQAALLAIMTKQMPNCKVILWKVSLPRSLLDISWTEY